LLLLRERLLGERGERLLEASQPIEPHSMDEADSATDEFDHDLALSKLSAEQDALYEVEEAIKRILNGTYGICEETGEMISESRLRAIPWTRFSREVQARLERKGKLQRASRRSRLRAWTGNGNLEPIETDESAGQPEAKEEQLGVVYSPPGKHIHPHTAMPDQGRSGKRKDVK
jgi:RNA polymerase-binding transcription factor DksA